MSRRDLWQTLHERFDPELPAPMQWRAERPYTPAQRMLGTLERPFGTPRILLTGTVGTGKTTELLHVAEVREARELVVFLDLERHFTNVVKDANALYRIEAWEVCFLAGLALVFRFKERLGFELEPEMVQQLGKAWQGLAEATKTPNPQLDLGSFAKEALDLGATLASKGALGLEAAVALQGAKTVMGALRWTLPLGRSEKALPDQDRQVQELLNAVNLLLGEVQQKHRKVLLVIDGNEWRLRQETGLNTDHIQLLQNVMKDPEHRLPSGELAYELLDYQHLLPYPNKSEWYYPHPLLTMNLVRRPQAGSAG